MYTIRLESQINVIIMCNNSIFFKCDVWKHMFLHLLLLWVHQARKTNKSLFPLPLYTTMYSFVCLDFNPLACKCNTIMEIITAPTTATTSIQDEMYTANFNIQLQHNHHYHDRYHHCHNHHYVAVVVIFFFFYFYILFYEFIVVLLKKKKMKKKFFISFNSPPPPTTFDDTGMCISM